ncbi:MAG: hypothetical protein Q4A73_02545, partial [Campylobacter sp.]|nr:hypothetical protein [Campylobacter sp.]
MHNNGAQNIVIINSGTIEGYETEGTVQNFQNTGAITGNGLSVRSTIKTLTLGNNSTINKGIELRGTIQSLTNDSSTLKITNYARGQIQNLQGSGTITSLDNRGTIKTLNNTMNGNLTNSGKIESGSITFQSGQLTNQQSGTIGGTVSGTITSLDNQGTIKTLNNTMNGNLTNSGKIESGSITFQSGQLTNQQSGTIGGTVSGTITSLDNQGTIKTLNN